MTNQEKYNTLRKTHPVFVYESYQYNVQPDGLHIVFSFRQGEDCWFTPETIVPHRGFLTFDQPKATMDALVFNIGMVEMVSYWKSACAPRVEVKCGNLDDGQRAFWKKLYWNGLGEFFYVNGIEATIDDFMTIDAGEHTAGCVEPLFNEGRQKMNEQAYLVPIGGGKDSVVSLELLQPCGTADISQRPVPLIMNPRGATVGCIEAAGYNMDDVLVMHRTIDPHLLKLNSQGYLNGHTPFSAMLAFYTLMAAQLSGISNIALSNESSANESTVLGTGVNHQYSKSLEFENDLRAYVARYLPGGYNYFSLLRPLTELQIAALFSRHEKYHDVFRSCNAGSKQDVWCGKCAKCLFAYIILSPFIAPERMMTIFGKNMLDDPSMQREFDQLTGRAETKPFECVGTVDEVHQALSMTLERWYQTRKRPALLEEYRERPVHMRLDSCLPDHNLNENEINLLLSHVRGITT